MQKKAIRKHTNTEKYLDVWIVKIRELFELLTTALIRELSVIAIVANSVDAIKLFRMVCTANTPFFPGSCTLCQDFS